MSTAKEAPFQLAERWYRRAVDASPSDATYRIFLGGFLAIAGRLKEAEAVHRRATRCKVGFIDEAFFNRGLVLRALERYSDARTCFERALEIDPKYKEARAECGTLRRSCHASVAPNQTLQQPALK